MESVIQLSGKKRGRESDIDWTRCLICDKPPGKQKITELHEQGISRINYAVQKRCKSKDISYMSTLDKLSGINLKEASENNKIICHKACYASFTSESHIARVLKEKNSITGENDNNSENIIPNKAMSIDQENRPVCRSSFKFDKNLCIFCQTVTKEQMYRVMTKEMSNKVLSLGQYNINIKCRLSGNSDLIASDALYHLKCYIKFCREAEKHVTSLSCVDKTVTVTADDCLTMVIAELEDGFRKLKVYTLKDVWVRYCDILTANNLQHQTYESARKFLKDALCKHFGDSIKFVNQFEPYKPQLVFNADICATAIRTIKANEDDDKDNSLNADEIRLKAGFENRDSEQFIFMFYSASIIRADIKALTTNNDVLNISQERARKCIPDSLYTLISLICSSEENDHLIDEDLNSTCLSICQDLVYAVSKNRVTTPKHIGIATSIHHATRSKSLIDLLHAAGHCISYEQLRRIDTAIAKREIDSMLSNDNLPMLRDIVPGCFFQFSADNIDVLEETIDGKGTFHGTQIVAFQCKPAYAEQKPTPLQLSRDRRILQQPQLHALQSAPIVKTRQEPLFLDDVQSIWYDSQQSDAETTCASEADFVWAVSRTQWIAAGNQRVPSWTAFNRMVTTDISTPSLITFLPIVNAPAHDNDTLWTVLNRCVEITKRLNPNQTTVITLDEQLYSKARELQSVNAELLKNIVLRLGSFHIALNFLKVIGNYCSDCGLTDIWVDSDLFSDTTAQNIISGKSYNRALRAHKITHEAFFRLMFPLLQDFANKEDFDMQSLTDEASQLQIIFGDNELLKDMRSVEAKYKRVLSTAQSLKLHLLIEKFDADRLTRFKFWRTYMTLVEILLRFLRAERLGDWKLHLASFRAMLPYFAVFDHINYTRWGAVYLADMNMLQKLHPDVYSEFMSGSFVVKETIGNFNKISTDLALEHVNKSSKIAGGLVGITKTDSARDQWCLTFNERSRLVAKTYSMLGISFDDDDTESFVLSKNKEFGCNRIKRDEADVVKLAEKFKMHRVFERTEQSLICLSTKDVASDAICTSLNNLEKLGNSKVQEFVSNRLCAKKVGFHERLPASKVLTFKHMYQVHVPSDKTTKFDVVKADRKLFQRLLVAKDGGRDVDLKQLLQSELAPVPQSLVNLDGKLRSGDKSSLAHLLYEQHIYPTLPTSDGRSSCIVDGQAVVQALAKPAAAKTFGDLAGIFFNVAIARHIRSGFHRVDVIFDRYENSIKDDRRTTRTKGKKAVLRLIESNDTPLPADWQSFISSKDNKANLAHFLSIQIIEIAKTVQYEVITAGGLSERVAVLSTSADTVDTLQSSHDEADTRIILHALHAKQNGYRRILVVASDTDVLVLLLHFASVLCNEIWLEINTTKQKKFIAVHEIQLENKVRHNLPSFHALTGCDTVSQFNGIGKKTAWKSFIHNPTLLDSLGIDNCSNDTFKKCEEFVCNMYLFGTDITSVNELRYQLFMKGQKDADKLPPTKCALEEHVKRAHFQSRIWRQAHVRLPILPSPVDNGWYQADDGSLQPQLLSANTLPVPQTFTKVLSCKCKDCSSKRCSCRNKDFGCFAACACRGNASCHNPWTAIDESE